MEAALYINSRGQNVTRHSFTAGDEFRFCPRKYQHKRIGGWQEKEKNAAMDFGNCIEAAIRYHHEEHNVLFSELWVKFKDTPLVYSDKEGSWEELNLTGQEMLRLYELKLPTFPFDLSVSPKFQIPYSKEVFPGTKLAGIEFWAYVDARFKGRDNRYWTDTNRPQDRWIVDIKTSGVALDTTPDILSLDPQLRSYAWVTGIPNVAFLWFQKVGRKLKKGDEVTVLHDTTVFKAGESATVLFTDDSFGTATILSRVSFEDYEKEAEGKKGKALDAVKAQFSPPNKGEGVAFQSITKQKLSFVPAYISEEAQNDIGQQIGRDIVQIHAAHEDNWYPQTGGVRFPNQKCPTCPMLGLCLNKPELRDERLIRIDDIGWE